ncbi:hypothetical protein SRB17_04870 [Streptomyces sp. RB17]|uniref:hypothetical protein n=1 Tax=Streptomyces sp. RB17 TaxID=2585197 RepID=UPI0012960C85|nr:hypothetical protein [Streptomyces sp. RB17]MQY32536.1 hypothetical protein [Streptomyces sp. RB17]
MKDLRTPTRGDFHAYADLAKKQGSHLSTLVQWSSNECAKADGLDGLLLPLRPLIPEVSAFFHGKFAQCERGMVLVGEKIHRTSAVYTETDQNVALRLRNIYPQASSHFPDIGAIPGLHRVGNFNDEEVELKAPDSAEDDTSRNIEHQLWALGWNSDLRGADSIFKFCTGKSLVELLLTPLSGKYGRLLYLHDVYDALGDAAYTVTGTLRKGSWELGTEWTGQAATAFDSYLFNWTMGMGGVGDAAKEAAKLYKVGYETIVVLVHLALREINKLINNEIKELVKQAEEMAAGDAMIEGIGLGPEDPLADAVAGFFTADKMYKIYKIVKYIITGIAIIEGIYGKISDAVEAINKGVRQIVEFSKAPEMPEIPSVSSLLDEVEQHGFAFEKSDGWNATVGAARIGLLPAA